MNKFRKNLTHVITYLHQFICQDFQHLPLLRRIQVMRKVGFCCLVFCLGMSHAYSSSISGKVIEVIDGNTLVVRAEEETYTIVFHLIDSPDPGQPYAGAAQEYLQKKLLKKQVTVHLVGKDRRGNYLGVIFLRNSVDVRHDLISRGLAWVEEGCTDPQLFTLQEQARQQRIGLWREDNPTPPWVYRRLQSMMTPKSS
jgi:micrococcal nuclease